MAIKKVLPILLSVLMFLSMGAAAATSNTTSYSVNQIGQSAGNVKSYVETQNGLPSKVSIGNRNVTTAQFLYLMTSATAHLANNTKSNISLKNVSSPTKPTETFKGGTISNSTYISMARSVNSYIAKYGKAPNYVTTSLGTIKYQSMVFMFSKIMKYYKDNNKLPKTVTLKTWYAQTLGPAGQLNATLKNGKKIGANKYGYVMLYGPYGNASSKNKVAVIVGVHPQEEQTHIAMFNAVSKLSSTLKNVQIWVYKVYIYTQYQMNRDASRTYGQNLAHDYIVPNIGTSYKLVVDTHGNRGTTEYTGYPNFVFAPLNDAKSNSMVYKLTHSAFTNGALVNHFLSDGTSPVYVTKPLARKGIPTIVYEQYSNQANYAKVMYSHAMELLRAINSIFA